MKDKMYSFLKRISKVPVVLRRHITPLRRPPRLEGKVQNVGIRMVRKKKKKG